MGRSGEGEIRGAERFDGHYLNNAIAQPGKAGYKMDLAGGESDGKCRVPGVEG
jgi:hypothetical protein